jgi:chromosome segregation ATPase
MTELEQQMAELDSEIAALEAEQETPPRVLSWSEIDETMLGKLEAAERRRGILPRLITAAKVRRLELERAKYERAMEPLEKQQLEACERSEKLRVKLHKLQEELNDAHQDHHDATWRLDGYRRRDGEIAREIAALRGEE